MKLWPIKDLPRRAFMRKIRKNRRLRPGDLVVLGFSCQDLDYPISYYGELQDQILVLVGSAGLIQDNLTMVRKVKGDDTREWQMSLGRLRKAGKEDLASYIAEQL